MERSVDFRNKKVKIKNTHSLPKITKLDKSKNKNSKQTTILPNMRKKEIQYDTMTSDFFQRNSGIFEKIAITGIYNCHKKK